MSTPKQKLDTLAHGVCRIIAESSSNSTMRVLVETALQLVTGEAGTWGIVENGAMVFREYRSSDGRWHAVHQIFQDGDGVPGWVMRNRQPCLSNDPGHDNRAIPDIIQRYGIRNLIDLPILNRDGELLGCFELHNKRGGADFTEADLVLLDALSAIASVLLRNEKLAQHADTDRRQRNRAEAELEVERSRLVELFRQAPAFIAVLHGPDHVFDMINPHYQRLIGDRQVLGKPIRQALPEVVEQGFLEILDHVYHTATPYSAQGVRIALARSEGHPLEDHYVDFVYQPIREEDGRVSGIIALGTDITGQHEVERALATSREQERQSLAELETIYRTAPIGLALFDPVDFRYIRLNQRQADIVGLPPDQILGKGLTEIAPIAGLREMFEQVARGNPVKDALLEGELPLRPGEHRYWTVNYDPVYGSDGKLQAISAASLEVTAQKRAELALIQSEKLAAAGRLAASIAHEINNPLEAVTNLLYLIQSSDNIAEAQNYASLAQTELVRVAELTQRTLRFHRQSTRPTEVRISDLIDSVLAFYETRLLRDSIQVWRRYRDRPILCFESEVRQVLNNLIGNALDALPPGGTLSLRASVGRQWKTGKAGIRVSVADTGHGIEPAAVKRIFEPFFTTKPATGTGLGLWVTCEILKRHHGTLRVRSSQVPEKCGSVFSFLLPFEEAGLRAPETLIL